MWQQRKSGLCDEQAWADAQAPVEREGDQSQENESTKVAAHCRLLRNASLVPPTARQTTPHLHAQQQHLGVLCTTHQASSEQIGANKGVLKARNLSAFEFAANRLCGRQGSQTRAFNAMRQSSGRVGTQTDTAVRQAVPDRAKTAQTELACATGPKPVAKDKQTPEGGLVMLASCAIVASMRWGLPDPSWTSFCSIWS